MSSAAAGRPAGWAPSSVRDVLIRPPHRGVLTYGQTRKRDLSGKVKPSKRPESEWIRVPAPALRIVDECVALAVDARFHSTQTTALRRADGSCIRRPSGERPAKFLLTGFLKCGACGGSMEVLSTTASGGRRVHRYDCQVARRKGPSACSNRLPAHMHDTDEAVIALLKKTLLHPAVVERAVARAEAALAAEATADPRVGLQRDLAEIDQASKRLVAAITKGGDLAVLVKALQDAEKRRQDVEATLAGVGAPAAPFDAVHVRGQLLDALDDWRGLLRGHVPQVRAVLKRLIKGRLTMTPTPKPSCAVSPSLPRVDVMPSASDSPGASYYNFSGVGTLVPLLAGGGHGAASPTGLGKTDRVGGRLRRAA